jgi:outer membrane protein W
MRLALILALTTLFTSSPAMAQTFDVFVRGVEATREGKTHVHGGAAEVKLNSARGLEGGVDVFWNRHLSAELAVSSVHHELDASAFGQNVDLGGTRFMPFSAILEWHTDPHETLDIHAGAGAAYARFSDVADTPQLTLLGVRSIAFHDKIAPVVCLGASFRVGERWSVTTDAKYFVIRTRTTATYLDGTSEGAALNLKQLSVGAGLALRF